MMTALVKRFATVLLTAFMLIGTMAPAALAGSYENDALTLLNAERAAAGLAPLTSHPDLADDALAWSNHMMGQGSLSHNPRLSAVTANWDKLGENVGLGTSIASLHAAFMDSSSHRGNILGDYDHVGIAVVAETSSKLWITVVFMKSLDSTPEAETSDDPEPYSDVQPIVDNDQPAAAPATQPAAPAPVAPAPSVTIAFVATGASPIAD